MNCAIIIQHLQFLQKSMVGKDDDWTGVWVRRSTKTLRDTYPYFTDKEIRGALDRMEKWELIMSKIDNNFKTDRTKSFQLTANGRALMETGIDKRANVYSPKGQMEVPKKSDVDSPKGRSIKEGYSSSNHDVGNLVSPDADAPDRGPTVEVEEIEVLVEDGKNGTASRGAGSQTKSWTRQAAEAFDTIAIEKCKAHHIDYQPFNWSVCQEENFRQLRMLREKAIVVDFKNKWNAEPTEEQVMGSFRAVFRLAWEYFYKIHKEKGGALHYTPTSIYKSYNAIKTTAQNGNINGNGRTTDAERDIYHRHTFGQGIDDFGSGHS